MRISLNGPGHIPEVAADDHSVIRIFSRYRSGPSGLGLNFYKEFLLSDLRDPLERDLTVERSQRSQNRPRKI